MAEDQRSEDLTPGEALESTLWQLVRDMYLRCLMHPRDPQAVPVSVQNAILESHFPAMEHDVKRLCAVVSAERSRTIGDLHVRLHSAEGLDHEMVDQAVEYATGVIADDTPEQA